MTRAHRRSLVWCLALAAGVTGGAWADEDERRALVQRQNSVELGAVLAQGGQGYAQNRVVGAGQEALRPALSLDLASTTPYSSDDGLRWRLSSQNLGLPDAIWQAEWGQLGAYRWQYSHEQQRYTLGSAYVTPFLGAGSAALSLPSGLTARTASGPSAWSAAEKASANSALNALDLQLTRNRDRLAFQGVLAPYWQVRASYQREQREGLKATGAASGTPGGSALILPEPIMHSTDRWELGLDYAQAGRRFAVAYQASLFSNQIKQLDFQNPFSSGSLNNRLSTAPDNQAHYLKLDGGWRVSPYTALSGALSWGRLWQDQAFLPYSTAAGAPALPQASLQGMVATDMAQWALHTRPAPQWNLALRYRYEGRDDRTPVASYQHVTNEVGVAFPVSTNTPRSRRLNRISGEADYHLAPDSALRLTLEQERLHRYCATGVSECTEVSDTQEHSYRLEWRRPWLDNITMRLSYGAAQRRGSQYLALADSADLAGLRKFLVADRDRYSLNLSLQGLVDEQFSWSGQLLINDDHYGQSQYGLTRARNWALNVDGQWDFGYDFKVHAFTGLSQYYSQLNSSYATEVSNGVAVERNDAAWSAHSWDQVLSVGLGASQGFWSGRLNVSADVLWLQGHSRNDISGGTCAANAGTSPCTGNSTSPLPEQPLRSRELRLSALYSLDARSSLRFTYRYTQLAVSDYAYDSVGLTTSSRVLGSGERPPNYAGHVLGVGYRYGF